MLFKDKIDRISAWWGCQEVDCACVSFSFPLPGKDASRINLNRYWPDSGSEPDFGALVDGNIEKMSETCYFGEAIPYLSHAWGGRGTPMVMAAYLGGKVNLREDTVWVDPVIDDYEKFKLRFDDENTWFKKSLEFFRLTVEKGNGRFLPVLPDFGDALTVLSLLRGTERLLIDLLENKEAVLEFRDEFVRLWPEYHGKFWSIYSKKFDGDTSWLGWAPGYTYPCQCDFSTMISPRMFVEFVVPEIEAMGKYLDYIIWHLDGPEDEIKHLNILLDMPEIKAIQWSHSPRNSVVKFLPYFKRIQERNKSLLVYPKNENEVEILLRELSPTGLLISGGFTGKTEEDALRYIDMVRKMSSGG